MSAIQQKFTLVFCLQCIINTGDLAMLVHRHDNISSLVYTQTRFSLSGRGNVSPFVCYCVKLWINSDETISLYLICYDARNMSPKQSVYKSSAVPGKKQTDNIKKLFQTTSCLCPFIAPDCILYSIHFYASHGFRSKLLHHHWSIMLKSVYHGYHIKGQILT